MHAVCPCRWAHLLVLSDALLFGKLSSYEAGGVGAVMGGAGENLLFAVQGELRTVLQESLNLQMVFLRLDAAGAVDQASAGAHQPRRAPQDVALQAHEFRQSGLRKVCADIGSPPDDACVAAWDVEKNAVLAGRREGNTSDSGYIRLDNLYLRVSLQVLADAGQAWRGAVGAEQFAGAVERFGEQKGFSTGGGAEVG